MAVVTHKALAAGGIASVAVARVGLEVDAGLAAGGESGLAGWGAASGAVADLAAKAALAAAAAMEAVAEGVYADAVALGEADLT